MQLRPYQQTALAATLEALRTERFILLQAATGAGKTILFSALIRHCMEQFDMRVGVIAHREVLVRQAYDKLLKVWPEGRGDIGLACASVDKTVELERRVVIGSPQTLVRRLHVMPPLHLLIIDECHRVPPANEKSQYRELVDKLTEYYPKLRVVGVTATPYRLGHGMIYGQQCRAGKKNWWERLHCEIGMGTLQEQGFLVPLRAKEAENIADDLESIRTDKGEYNVADLANLMEREMHIGSAVNAYNRYGEGRRHVVVFAVTIAHAEKLAEAFRAAGYASGCVHSQMDNDSRSQVLEAFETGHLQVVCNVGVLTEGWDCTAVDCMIFCRPTLSPALYVQMVGRGLRPNTGKSDCLLLDLSGNCCRHGDPSSPHIPVPTGQSAKKEDREARMKACDNCAELVAVAARECPACGYTFPQPEIVERNAEVDMREVDWGPQKMRVLRSHIGHHVSRRSGNLMLRFTMLCQPENTMPVQVNHYMDIEGQGSEYGLSRARMLWRKLAGTEPPLTVSEALERLDELTLPETLLVKRNGDFLNVVRW